MYETIITCLTNHIMTILSTIVKTFINAETVIQSKTHGVSLQIKPGFWFITNSKEDILAKFTKY